MQQQQQQHGESVLSNAHYLESADPADKKSQRHATTTATLVECSSYSPPPPQQTCFSKLSVKPSTIGLQAAEPGSLLPNSAQQHSRFGSPIYPPTPPSGQLSSSSPTVQQQQPDTCAESIGSNLSAASSVNEVGKKRKLGFTTTSPAGMKNSTTGGAGGGMSPPLLSPSISKKQPRSPSGSGSVASTITTQEIASTTTFVQADTSSFRELVQKLTGASDSDLEKFPITMTSRQAAARAGGGTVEATGTHKQHDNTFGGLLPKPVSDLSVRQPPFKLHERRQTFNIRKLEVKGLGAAAAFRRGTASYGGLSPSSAAERCSSPLSQKFPSLLPSPVTPLTMDAFDKTHAPTTPKTFEPCPGLLKPSPHSISAAEGTTTQKDIMVPHFFLHHPSPPSERPRSKPELLTLFPLTSPRASETS